MRSVRGKLIILVALGLVWALIFVTRRPSEPPARAGAQAASRPARAPAGPSGTTPRLKVELLNLPRAPYPSEEHNIFGTPPPPPPPSRPPESTQSTAPVAPPPDPFQEEAKQLRFVGFLRDGGTATAFIIQGQQVHTVAVGDLVAGRFRVADVGEDFVVLASPGGDKQVRLPLATETGSAPRPSAPGGPPTPAGPPGVSR
jgi:hypothetical protein